MPSRCRRCAGAARRGRAHELCPRHAWGRERFLLPLAARRQAHREGQELALSRARQGSRPPAGVPRACDHRRWRSRCHDQHERARPPRAGHRPAARGRRRRHLRRAALRARRAALSRLAARRSSPGGSSRRVTSRSPHQVGRSGSHAEHGLLVRDEDAVVSTSYRNGAGKGGPCLPLQARRLTHSSTLAILSLSYHHGVEHAHDPGWRAHALATLEREGYRAGAARPASSTRSPARTAARRRRRSPTSCAPARRAGRHRERLPGARGARPPRPRPPARRRRRHGPLRGRAPRRRAPPPRRLRSLRSRRAVRDDGLEQAIARSRSASSSRSTSTTSCCAAPARAVAERSAAVARERRRGRRATRQSAIEAPPAVPA